MSSAAHDAACRIGSAVTGIAPPSAAFDQAGTPRRRIAGGTYLMTDAERKIALGEAYEEKLRIESDLALAERKLRKLAEQVEGIVEQLHDPFGDTDVEITYDRRARQALVGMGAKAPQPYRLPSRDEVAEMAKTVDDLKRELKAAERELAIHEQAPRGESSSEE